MNNTNENQNKTTDEVIKCVAFLADDTDNQESESLFVGIDTKRKPTNISKPVRQANIISEKI